MCLHVPREQVTFWTSVVTVVAHQLSLHALRCPLRRHFDNFLRSVSICRSNRLAFCERLAALFFEVINRHVSIALRHTLLVGLTHDQYVAHLQLKCFAYVALVEVRKLITVLYNTFNPSQQNSIRPWMNLDSQYISYLGVTQLFSL